MELQELIEKIHPGRSEKDRALLAVNAVLAILHPKFDEEWETQGYSKDEEGYVEDFQWSAGTIEAVAGILCHYGFSPPSSVRYELEITLRAMEDDNDDEE